MDVSLALSIENNELKQDRDIFMKCAMKLLLMLMLFNSVSSIAQSFDWLKPIKHEDATAYIAKDGHWLINSSSIKSKPNKSRKFTEYIKRIRKAPTAQMAAKIVLQQIVDTSKNSTTGYISVNDELNFYYTPIVETKSPEATHMPATSLLLRHYRKDIKQVMEIVLSEVSAVKKVGDM